MLRGLLDCDCLLRSPRERQPMPPSGQVGPHARAKWTAWQSGGDRLYSTLMPANLITFAHLSMASVRIVPNSAGEPPSTVPPSSTLRALILGSARPALSSLFSIWMISGGVPLG